MTPGDRQGAAYAVPDLDGHERAVLVALAFHADADTLVAWPSIALLARETAFSADTCRRAIRRLMDRGVIAAELSPGRRANKYRLVALQPSLLASVEPSPPATVADSNRSQQQSQPLLLASQPSLPATRTGKNRQRTGNGAHKRTRATAAPGSFTVTDVMREWAAREGVPPDRLDGETARFLDHHRSKGNTFKDWEAAWRNWMRKAAESLPAGERVAPMKVNYDRGY